MLTSYKLYFFFVFDLLHSFRAQWQLLITWNSLSDNVVSAEKVNTFKI